MAGTFSCPNCGAPLEYPGGDITTIPCQYCHHSIIVPMEVRSTSQTPNAASLPVTPDPVNPTISPELERLNELQKQASTEREFRRIERAKRRVIRHEVREEVRKSRRG